MNIFLKKRNYTFDNGWKMEVDACTQYMSAAHLYDDSNSLMLNVPVPKMTERLGIVRSIEKKCKKKLNIVGESLVYYISEVIVDEEPTNIFVVVTPYKQQAYAKIEVHLYEETSNKEVYNKICIVSFEAYRQIEESIKEVIDNYSRYIKSNKIYAKQNIPEIIKRVMFFNSGEYEVRIDNKKYYTAVNNITAYNNMKSEKVFEVPVPKINFYERAEVIKIVVSLFAERGINLQMDSEYSEYIHGTWGTFIVKPIGNSQIEISKHGGINIKRKYDIDYNNYNGIVQCINDIIEKLDTNVMKYADKDQAGDINFERKEKEKANRRREEARRQSSNINIEQPTIKGLFGLFNRK